MPRAQGCAGAACVSIARHMGRVRETGLGHERYIAIEHMDVRRDCVSFARHTKACVSFARHTKGYFTQPL